MKIDFKRPNGTIKRTQYCKAPRAGVSSMGTPYKRGEPILHMSSSRATGETFILTPLDLENIMSKFPGEFCSPKKWSDQLHKKWQKETGGTLRHEAVHGHSVHFNRKMVLVDGVEVHSDAEYKAAMGLDHTKKYPHPLGMTDDWATLAWQQKSA